MNLTPLAIPGAYRIDPELLCDERGFFARSWCQKEFAAHGLNPRLVQCTISYNRVRGTLRGIHYQDTPQGDAKLIRCTQGAIYDVVLDLRQDSPTFGSHVGEFLSADDHRMLYVPEGCGHGFLTLESKTEVFYQMSEYFTPESARGVRWDDPAFGIPWPSEVAVISDRDRHYADFVWDGEEVRTRA